MLVTIIKISSDKDGDCVGAEGWAEMNIVTQMKMCKPCYIINMSEVIELPRSPRPLTQREGETNELSFG